MPWQAEWCQFKLGDRKILAEFKLRRTPHSSQSQVFTKNSVLCFFFYPFLVVVLQTFIFILMEITITLCRGVHLAFALTVGLVFDDRQYTVCFVLCRKLPFVSFLPPTKMTKNSVVRQSINTDPSCCSVLVTTHKQKKKEIQINLNFKGKGKQS